MLHELLSSGPSEFAAEYAGLLGVCPDASLAVAEAVLSRRPDMAKEKKALLSSCTAHVKANPAPDWLMSCGFFCQVGRTMRACDDS